jgi:N-acyl-D-aspartate/D-glutamate deacylase
MTNLTPDERHELGDLVLDTRDAIRDLATDAESRRMAQLMAKALSGEAR